MKNKLMMKLFVASEAFFFLSLMMAYIFLWRNAGFTAEAKDHLNASQAGLLSGLLVASSFTFRIAERKYGSGKDAGVRLWLSATLLLGIVFLAGQAREYYSLLRSNLTIDKNEFGTGFFTLTGFHALHVFMGLIMLGVILFLSVGGYLGSDKKNVLAVAGIYWHFVDVMWVLIFCLIYLSPYLIS